MTPDEEYFNEMKDEIDGELVMCNSFTRFPYFLELIDILGLSGENYWYGLRCGYVGSDNLFSYRNEVKECFSKDIPYRERLMSKREQNYLKSLPDTITIYRGMTIEEFNSGDFGVSWTLKKSVGKFFSEKYRRNFSTKEKPKMVHQLTINKSEVICYFGHRKEYEIIYIHKKKVD